MNHESALIAQLSQLFLQPVHGLGIGDDCAVVPLNQQQAWLLSTDALVDGTHFCSNYITPEQLAYKAVMVNVSDIAAMGGTPQSVLLTLGLPQAFSTEWVTRFLTALATVLQELHITLIGGDTVGSEQALFINLTIIGTTLLAQIKYRHSAKAGDILAVTKPLGGSYAGLQLLLKNWRAEGTDAESCLQQHLMPQAQLAEGQWLARQAGVHAMMDLSDGLSADLSKLSAASKLGAELVLDAIPIDPAAARLAAAHQTRPIDIAYSGGEDYALLLTIAAEDFATINTAYQAHFNKALWPIGTMIEGLSKLTFDGQAFESQLAGFQHFD